MSYKKFSYIVLIFASALFVIAGFLHSLHLVYNENDRILAYQEHKLQKLTKIETLIVGDSSAGNAIDAKYFSKLSHSKTLNVALTGSYGIIGSLNMLKRVAKEHKELKNVIIMQSLDVWYRPLNLTSYFKTRSTPLSEMSGVIDSLYSKYFAFLFNIKEINWFIKYLYEDKDSTIDIKHDYTKQKKYTFANGKKRLKEGVGLKDKIDKDKLKILSLMDNFCGEKKLQCSYLHGALHVSLVKKDKKIIEHINTELSNVMKNIYFVPKPLAIQQRYMGDSNDHVDVSYKLQSTKESYNRIKENLEL